MQGILAAAIAAAVGAIFCGLAAWRNLGDAPTRRGAAAGFWITLSLYMACFSLLRVTHLLGGDALLGWFYLATISGAASVIFLTFILVGVIFGHRWSRLGAEIAAGAAIMILTLIFAIGIHGPRIGASIRFLPVSGFARVAVATVYIALPVAMVLLSLVRRPTVTWHCVAGRCCSARRRCSSTCPMRSATWRSSRTPRPSRSPSSWPAPPPLAGAPMPPGNG